MRLLAIDTSGLRCGAALLEDGQLKAWMESERGLTHSTNLMPLVHSLLENQGLKTSDPELLALAIGPGSYTGIRIGAATCQGIATVSGAKVIQVSTLAALALPWITLGLPVLSLIDARHERCYAGLYQGTEKLSRQGLRSLIEPRVYELTELVTLLGDYKQIVVTGDGQHYGAEDTALGRLEGVELLLTGVTQNSAADVGRLAAKLWEQDAAIGVDPAQLRPVYMNRTAAEKNFGIEVD